MEIVVLNWKKYQSISAIRDCKDNETWSGGKGVYLLADQDNKPLYIGMTFGKEGIAERYCQAGLIDASLKHGKEVVFFARVVKSRDLCKNVEAQLIDLESKCNKDVKLNNVRKSQQKKCLNITHEGDVPRFHYLKN